MRVEQLSETDGLTGSVARFIVPDILEGHVFGETSFHPTFQVEGSD